MSTPTTQNRDVPENVHPSAVGSGTQPQTSTTRQESTVSRGGQDSASAQEGDLPPQRHAGKLDGPGPEFKKGAGLGDKMTGLQEEIKGKVLRKPEVAQHGHDLRTGELKRRQHEQDFDADPPGIAQEKEAGMDESNTDHDAQETNERPQERKGSSSLLDAGQERQQAATISPEGTEGAEHQRKGGNVEGQKMID